MKPSHKKTIVALMALWLSGCDGFTHTMGPTEVGLRFRRLPAFIGGTSTEIIRPGQLALLFWPFDRIYTYDTAVKDVSWPNPGKDNDPQRGFVNTRAKDGNEVALAVTVRYRVMTDPEKLHVLLQTGASSDYEVRKLVISVGRAEIRTYMNRLGTTSFLNEEERYRTIDQVKDVMNKFFEPMGIEISRVILDDFRFERLLRDGTIDASYQEKLTDIQKTREDTSREMARIETVKAKKDQELNTLQAKVNRQIAEAEGFKKQATLKGDAYFQSKANEAKGILALGKAEVEGLTKQIAALSGPGGHAILKLEIAKQLAKNDPKFVVLDQGKNGQGVQVQRMDANDLVNQLGIMEGAQPKKKGPKGTE